MRLNARVRLLEPLVARVGPELFGTPRSDVRIDDLTVPGAEGDLPARPYRPAAADDAIDSCA